VKHFWRLFVGGIPILAVVAAVIYSPMGVLAAVVLVIFSLGAYGLGLVIEEAIKEAGRESARRDFVEKFTKETQPKRRQHD
jgi:hypothetical protein